MSFASRITRGSAAVAEDISSLSTSERLLFSQGVYQLGTNAWGELAKLLSRHPLMSRPKNYFTAQSCAQIYSYLMSEAGLDIAENTDGPKAGAHLKLAQRHYVNRTAELRDELLAEETKFKLLVNEIDLIRSGAWDDKILEQMNGVSLALERHALPVPEAPTVVSPRQEPEQEVTTKDVTPDRTIPHAPSPPVEIDEEPAGPAHQQPERLEQEEEIAVTDELHETEEDAMEVSSPSPAAEATETARTVTDLLSAEVTDVHEESSLLELNQPEVAVEEDVDDVVVEVVEEEQPKTRTSMRLSARQGRRRSTTERTEEEEAAIEPEIPKVREKPRSKSSNKSPSQDMRKGEEEEERLEEEDAVQNEILDVEGGEVEVDAAEAEVERAADEEVEDVQIEVTSRESSRAPSARRQSKRRASVSGLAMDLSKDRKRLREESEPPEDAESPATPSASAGVNIKERKRFQNVIYMLHSQISQHRNGTIFHNPIKPSEAPDYHDIVKRAMDLKTIKSRVRDGQIATSSEYQRDIYLMFANSLMYNRPNSDIYTMAEEMMHESEDHIHTFRQTEGYARRGF